MHCSFHCITSVPIGTLIYASMAMSPSNRRIAGVLPRGYLSREEHSVCLDSCRSGQLVTFLRIRSSMHGSGGGTGYMGSFLRTASSVGSLAGPGVGSSEKSSA